MGCWWQCLIAELVGRCSQGRRCAGCRWWYVIADVAGMYWKVPHEVLLRVSLWGVGGSARSQNRLGGVVAKA